MFSIEKAKELFRKKGPFRVHYNKQGEMESVFVMSTSGHLFFRLTKYHLFFRLTKYGDLSEGGEREIHLSDFSVEEQFRGLGEGDKCLDKIIEICKELGADKLLVSVEDVDSWVSEWFQRKGFKVDTYYEDCDDQLFLNLKK